MILGGDGGHLYLAILLLHIPPLKPTNSLPSIFQLPVFSTPPIFHSYLFSYVSLFFLSFFHSHSSPHSSFTCHPILLYLFSSHFHSFKISGYLFFPCSTEPQHPSTSHSVFISFCHLFFSVISRRQFLTSQRFSLSPPPAVLSPNVIPRHTYTIFLLPAHNL